MTASLVQLDGVVAALLHHQVGVAADLIDDFPEGCVEEVIGVGFFTGARPNRRRASHVSAAVSLSRHQNVSIRSRSTSRRDSLGARAGSVGIASGSRLAIRSDSAICVGVRARTRPRAKVDSAGGSPSLQRLARA